VTAAADTLTVFVNERAVPVHRGASMAGAVRAFDASLADALAEGQAHLTDGRGIRLDPSEPATAGAIIRLVRSARQPREPDADA
jgi:hypothetical protein